MGHPVRRWQSVNRPGEVFGVESAAKRTSMPFAVDGGTDGEGAACRGVANNYVRLTRGPLSVAVAAVAAGVSYADRLWCVRPHTSGFGSGRKRCTMYLYSKSQRMQFKKCIFRPAEHLTKTTSIGGNSHAVAI